MPQRRKDDGDNVLRGYRVRRNLTQQEAADKVGVSRTLWSAWEGRCRPLTISQLNEIQSALKLNDSQIKDIRKWWGNSCLEDSAPPRRGAAKIESNPSATSEESPESPPPPQ